MNPTTLAQPAPRMVNDVSKPSQPGVGTPQTLTTSFVNNIPVHAPTHPLPAPANEDDELDKIMQDVGQQLKQAERQTPKKHHFHIGHKAKPLATVAPMASPAAVMPIHTAAAPQPVNHAPVSMNLRPDTTVKPAAKATTARHSSPVLIVLFTVAVTAALMAAAIYTYKLS